MDAATRLHLVVLTGAGISAESGIPTFRGIDGLWEGHRVEDVASPEGWRRDPSLVLEFYNQRRKAAVSARPNRGHEVLAELERSFKVTIITQNIDSLHEMAGSTNVVHLHGLICQSRSTKYANLIYEIDGWELKLGDLCEKGSQLRPNIVWFGESVPMIETAMEICQLADIFAVVGTSLLVYPAAGLIDFVPRAAKKFIIDPQIPAVIDSKQWTAIAQPASTGLDHFAELIDQYASPGDSFDYHQGDTAELYQRIYDQNPWYGDANQGRCPGVRLLPQYVHWLIEPVLDLGCGRGQTVEHLRELGFKAEGIDQIRIHPEMRVGDITKPIADIEQFNSVVCVDCIEHLFPDQVEGLFANMKRVQRQAFSIHNGESTGTGQELHVNRLEFSQWESLIAQHFKIESTISITPDQKLYLTHTKG